MLTLIDRFIGMLAIEKGWIKDKDLTYAIGLYEFEERKGSIAKYFVDKGYFTQEQFNSLHEELINRYGSENDEEITNKKSLFTTYPEILHFMFQFTNCTLPITQWNHKSHLVAALWFVSYNCSFDNAVSVMRKAIQKYNQHNNIITTDTSGYHETITLFWLHMTRWFLDTNPQHDLPILVEKLTSHFEDKKYILQYYSRDLIMSKEARQSWVKPDILPLP